ncbi:unnamed protein product [Cuscuta campestris]|uniref:Retrotransposon gag domain-containing protein n=1 Tax=Cuscuta campestris TaxID=132261 RepID=A0A484MBQ8_9ASTE|nr:unnamed protein product [Cuscuta campestris]
MDPIVNYDDDHHSEDESVQQNDHQNMNMNQNVPHQEAPNGGPVGVPQIDRAMMTQLLQQVLIMNQNVLAHVRQSEPRITLESLKKNGAEEFLGENIADPLVAFRWIERVQRVFENLKVLAGEWADFAVMLLQSNAYEWWKRTTRNANHPAKVMWAYFDQLFDHLAEFGQDLVNTTKRRCDRFVKGMRPKLQKHMSTTSRQDFGVMYEQAKEVVRTKEGVSQKNNQQSAKTAIHAASTSKTLPGKRPPSGPELQISKKANSLPMQSVASTSKGKQPMHPLCSDCNRHHLGECWKKLGCVWGAVSLATSEGIARPILVFHSLLCQHRVIRLLLDLRRASVRPLHLNVHKDHNNLLHNNKLELQLGLTPCKQELILIQTSTMVEIKDLMRSSLEDSEA